MNNVYLIDAIWPSTKSQNFIRNIIIVIFGTILLTVSAHVKIPIPPVPVTLQTLVVLVFAMTVGKNLAFITFAFYLFQGSIGLPVFANPPYSGPFYLIGSSGGYLFGMLIASYFVGYFSERNFDKKYFQSLFAIFFGTLIIFIPGIIWLGFWFDNFHPKLAESIGLYEGYKLALIHGLFAFKFTEPVKVALAASITPLLWQYISKK